jgi:hypothetical protein
VAEKGRQDRAVRLALQALRPVVEQPAQRECGRGALDEGDITGRRLGSPQHDQPAPVLAAGADCRDQPARSLVESGPPGQPGCPGPARITREQACRVLTERRAGQDLVGQVLQDDRAAGQRGGLPDDLLGWRTRYRELGEDLMQPLGGPELGQLGIDDARVHGLGDLDELGLPLEHDQGQLMVTGRGDQGGGQAAGVPGPELDGQGADADRSQLGHVPAQASRVVGQGDAGREHQLTAAQQMGGLSQLDDMNPAHGSSQAVRAGQHPRAAAADRFKGQDLSHGRQHEPASPPRRPGWLAPPGHAADEATGASQARCPAKRQGTDPSSLHSVTWPPAWSAAHWP